LYSGLALITLALFALPKSSGFGSIRLYIFLLGLGGGIIVTAANALVSDISQDRRATTLNLLNLFFGLGGLATPFISANLLRRNSIKLCYTVAALTAVTLVVHILTPMPPPSGARSFDFSDVGPVLGKPVLFLLALFLFLYVACEVGVWNWLAQHLIAQGIPESRALNILSLGFALGLLIGRVAVSPILISVPAPAGHAGGGYHDDRHDVSDAQNQQRHRRRNPRVSGRYLHGPGLPHHARHGR
jgi:fucose permease